ISRTLSLIIFYNDRSLRRIIPAIHSNLAPEISYKDPGVGVNSTRNAITSKNRRKEPLKGKNSPSSPPHQESSSPQHVEEAALRLAAIVESSDDAIVSKDLNGVVTSWNKSAERIFGYKAEEIIGQPITVIIPLELLSDETLILSKIRAGERVEHFQSVRLHKNGERIDVSLTVSPIKDEQGTVIGAAKIARDITQQKKMEAALHTSEKLASVGRLAATIAHEINNPLEAITNFIYLAKQHPNLPEKVQRY